MAKGHYQMNMNKKLCDIEKSRQYLTKMNKEQKIMQN